MKSKVIATILLFFFAFNPFAYAKNLNSNHTQDLETWKQSITDCVKEQEKDGFWIDIAVDESGSMSGQRMQKAFGATFELIDELSLKIDSFNSLGKEIYFNFYPFSSGITAAYSTGNPTNRTELEAILPNSWTNTGGGTLFEIVFYQFYKNALPENKRIYFIDDVNRYSPNTPIPPELKVNSESLNLCHVAIFLTDGEGGNYKSFSDEFLSQPHTFLLSAQIGSDIDFDILKNNLSSGKQLGGPRNNSLVLKIDDLDEIFTLWEDIIDTIEESIITSVEGAITVSNNYVVELCEAGTLHATNEKCIYEFSLTAFAESYYITGGALDNSGKSTLIDDLILRITPPDTNTPTDFDLGNKDPETKNIKNVEITVDPSKSKFSIKVDPQNAKQNVREWVGLWTIELTLKENSTANGRTGYIDQKVTGQVSTYLEGSDNVIPFKESCYNLTFEDNTGNVFNSSDYEPGSIIFKIQNESGKELKKGFQISEDKVLGSYCFTFDNSFSETTIYIKPIVEINVTSQVGVFPFPTESKEKKISIGTSPNTAVLNNFLDINFEPTANVGVLDDKNNTVIITENENTKIFFDCIKEWRPDEEGYLEPEKSIRFMGKDFEASCGDEIVLEKPGTYEFSTIISIDEINEGSGILAYKVEIFDNTFNQKTSLGSAEFKVLIYYVSATMRYLYSAIFFLATGLFIFGLDRILKLLQKGFGFPSNLRVLTFEISKNQNVDEFINDFKNLNPFNLPSSRRLKSQSVGSFNFYVKAGLKEINNIYIKTNNELLYKNDSSEIIERISSKEFPNLQLFSINQELKSAEILVFVDENFVDENFDTTGLFYRAIMLMEGDEQNSEDKNEIFTQKDTNSQQSENNENSNNSSSDTGTDWGEFFE